MTKVLHILPADKFAAPFIDFVEAQDLDFGEQLFFCIDWQGPCGIERRANVIFWSDFGNRVHKRLALLRQLYGAQKIILHGLWEAWFIRMLALQPWLLKKCYWIIWGGDLYTAKLGERNLLWYLHEWPRRIVIKRIGHLVTYIDGDVELARQWYGARGQYHECLMYPSNVYKHYDVQAKSNSTTCIQVGNSADPSNEHFEVFAALEKFKDEDISIYAPLSYGNKEYAREVAAEGARLFGDKFIAMTEFLPFDKYLEFLGSVDIAIFNHRRQQAMGNIVTLLGLGKKVYLRKNITSLSMFRKAGIKVFDNDHLTIGKINQSVALRNKQKIRSTFSDGALKSQWKALLE